jgi:hypothetical protein
MAWTELMAPAAMAGASRGAPAGGGAQGGIALIDFDAAGGVDLDRLERSLVLHGERIGHGRYRVSGGSQTHWVDLYSTAHPRCDCGDHLWRERICKHILAALLREGNDRVVAALGRLLGRWRESGGTPPQPHRKAA